MVNELITRVIDFHMISREPGRGHWETLQRNPVHPHKSNIFFLIQGASQNVLLRENPANRPSWLRIKASAVTECAFSAATHKQTDSTRLSFESTAFWTPAGAEPPSCSSLVCALHDSELILTKVDSSKSVLLERKWKWNLSEPNWCFCLMKTGSSPAPLKVHSFWQLL